MEVTEYRMSMHFGVCHGPIDYISQIIVNEKEAWAGRQEELGEILIDKPELFGGVKKEGGAVGTATYLPGAGDQTIPERLAAKAGRVTATMPAYRGMASVWFTEDADDSRAGFYWTANSPYLPGVWIKAARASTALNEIHARIYRGVDDIPPPATVLIAIERSAAMDDLAPNAATYLANAKQIATEALEYLRDSGDNIVGVRVYGFGFEGIGYIEPSLTKDAPSDEDYGDLIDFVDDLVAFGFPGWTSPFQNPIDDYNQPSSGDPVRRIILFLSRGNPFGSPGLAPAFTEVYAFNIDDADTSFSDNLDNTLADGVPILEDGDSTAVLAALEPLLGTYAEFDSNPAQLTQLGAWVRRRRPSTSTVSRARPRRYTARISACR